MSDFSQEPTDDPAKRPPYDPVTKACSVCGRYYRFCNCVPWPRPAHLEQKQYWVRSYPAFFRPADWDTADNGPYFADDDVAAIQYGRDSIARAEVEKIRTTITIWNDVSKKIFEETSHVED